MYDIVLIKSQQIIKVYRNISFQDKEHSSEMWLTTAESASLGAEEVAARLHVDVRTGLKWQEADHRRQLAGFNEFTVKEEDPPWKKYIEQVCILRFICIALLRYVYLSKSNYK